MALGSVDRARAISMHFHWPRLRALSGWRTEMLAPKLSRISCARRWSTRPNSSPALAKRRNWPAKMFSATVNDGMTVTSWNTSPTPRRTASASERGA